MNLIVAKEADQVRITEFLAKNPEINGTKLIDCGYIVEKEDEIIGCFVLELLKEDHYWLKQLYIVQAESASLPILVESILALAKKQNIKKVFVYSHQPMVDILLEALQFQQKEDDLNIKRDEKHKGKWWQYHVS